MAAPNLNPANADLDFLLVRVARALQLDSTRFELAVQRYKAVGEWLAAPDSPLARFRPRIYPQGSMALETTVRPRARDEYDLDLVCQMLATGGSAMQTFNLVYHRLAAHATYAKMLEPKNRCARLVYARDFHLDIIAAEPDAARGGTAILVPDRELRTWTPSNPLGFVAFFTDRSKQTLGDIRKRVDPVPRPTPVEEKPVLTIAVQLIKRRRDMTCAEETRPRSIVLTTLAAECYDGTDDVFTALVQIVAGIQRRIATAHPARISVVNPTNPDEQFCESFNDVRCYEAFKRFINQLERDLARIGAARGIAELKTVLADTFGEDPVTTAVRSYEDLLKTSRDKKTLLYTGAGAGGLSLVTPVKGTPHVAPQHRYFGDESGA